MNNTKGLTKYLERFSEVEDFEALSCETTYEHVVVIPAYDESSDFIHRLKKTAFDNVTRLLAVVVINSPEDGDNAAQEHTERLYHWLSTSFGLQYRLPLGEVYRLSVSPILVDCLVIKRFEPGQRIPKKQGVGLARKLGADVACALIYHRYVQSPIIHSTDADAVLPEDYFSLEYQPDVAAWVYPYWHRPAEDTHTTDAIRLYESSMQAYVKGLKDADSPYAYHTIGSLLAINYLAYAKVRGFPKRSAAEDFYILNKLAKVGRIALPNADVIELESRLSARVPFGTGPKLVSLQNVDLTKATLMYHPKCFNLLRRFLLQADALWGFAKLWDEEVDLVKVITSFYAKEPYEGFFIMRDGPTVLAKFITSSKTKAQYLKHFHDWFDAFQTLKFIHHCRDNGYPNLTLAEHDKLTLRLPPLTLS